MITFKIRDKSILELIQQGKDSKAISMLYDKSFAKIKNHVKNNSGNVQDAEDLFQDAVVILYKYIKTNKFDYSNDIDAFLFTICKNLWINTVKKRQKLNYSDDTNMLDSFNTLPYEQTLIDNERELLIQNSFEKLGGRCKEVLNHVIYFDVTMKELAEKMNFSSEDSAKTQHYKCKQKLIALLENNTVFKSMLNYEN